MQPPGHEQEHNASQEQENPFKEFIMQLQAHLAQTIVVEMDPLVGKLNNDTVSLFQSFDAKIKELGKYFELFPFLIVLKVSIKTYAEKMSHDIAKNLKQVGCIVKEFNTAVNMDVDDEVEGEEEDGKEHMGGGEDVGHQQQEDDDEDAFPLF